MATQTLALTFSPDLATPTARVFPADSDTQVSGSPFTLTQATNRKGYYAVTFTGTLAGTHLVVLYSGSTPVASGWVRFENADGTYRVEDEPPAAVSPGYTRDDLRKDTAAALGGDVTGDGAAYKLPGTATTRLTVTDTGDGNRTVSRS